jgi:hypothetical protein
MDFRQKEALIRRITTGKFITKINYLGNNHTVTFTDPSSDVSAEADFIYKDKFEELQSSDDLYTLEQSYDILKDKKIWTPKLENEYEAITSEVKSLQRQTSGLKFQKKEKKKIEAAIKKLKNRIEEINFIKNQLWSTTIDFLAKTAKDHFIIQNISDIKPNIDISDNANLLQLLLVYYNKGGITEAEYREIARTDPFRVYWRLSKETGTSLFNRNAAELTDHQYMLLSYALFYDFCFESLNRPDDEIINDDIAIDTWYRNEIDRIKKERGESELNKTATGQEVFIMADAETAKDIYELNSPISRAKIKTREKVINEKGVVDHMQLPDVQQDLRIAANQMSFQRKF